MVVSAKSRNRTSSNLWKRLTGRSTNVAKMVQQFRSAEQAAKKLSDVQLRTLAIDVRDAVGLKQATVEQQAKYGGLVAESIFRNFGFRLHDVQVQAVVAGSRGAIVEMQTGEGKTVVTGAMAAIKSLGSPSVHVATTNAYLAERDLEDLRSVFHRLGLESGLLPEGNDLPGAQQAYAHPITYGPGYQFGFDYLRDQVVLRENRQSRLGCQTLNSITGFDLNKQLMQPSDHHTMLIDEADSVMIDEAVTPLVISGPVGELTDATPFHLARSIAAGLVLDEDFTIELPDKRIKVTDQANDRCHEAIADQRNLNLERPWRLYISNALRAQHVFRRDVDYVVLEGEVQIVDQYTGRIFSDRTWQEGLHQAVEAKEKVEVKAAANSVARISRQRYLQMYQQLAGLTGTASAVAREFEAVYGTKVICIPTNLPCIRKMLPTRFFRDVEAKLAAVADDAIIRHRTGQPILIGTRTIHESQQVFDQLSRQGINAILLNGVQDRDEADIVAEAGKWGAVTIATNMAGRGTDIKLDARAKQTGGLHVIGFSPNGSTRIDRQLVGRAARQGNPGSAQFFVSPQDDIVANHAPQLAKKISRRASATGEAKTGFSKELLALQGQVEAKQFAARQSMMRQEYWMDLVRESIENE